MSLIKKLVLAGVFSAVISLGIAGIGTASADGGNDTWNNPCIADGTHAIEPACWQGVIWGGPERGWIPQAGYYNNAAGNFWQVYYLLNFYNPYWYNYSTYWYNYAPYSNQSCWANNNMGFWSNGYWYSCATNSNGYWSNGVWYPIWH
jgi:hypothetical protein